MPRSDEAAAIRSGRSGGHLLGALLLAPHAHDADKETEKCGIESDAEEEAGSDRIWIRVGPKTHLREHDDREERTRANHEESEAYPDPPRSQVAAHHTRFGGLAGPL